MGSPVENVDVHNCLSQWDRPHLLYVLLFVLVLLFALWCLPMGVPLKQWLIFENCFSQWVRPSKTKDNMYLNNIYIYISQ